MTTCSLLRDSAIVLFTYSNVWDQIKIGKGHLSEIAFNYRNRQNHHSSSGVEVSDLKYLFCKNFTQGSTSLKMDFNVHRLLVIWR